MIVLLTLFFAHATSDDERNYDIEDEVNALLIRVSDIEETADLLHGVIPDRTAREIQGDGIFIQYAYEPVKVQHGVQDEYLADWQLNDYYGATEIIICKKNDSVSLFDINIGDARYEVIPKLIKHEIYDACIMAEQSITIDLIVNANQYCEQAQNPAMLSIPPGKYDADPQYTWNIRVLIHYLFSDGILTQVRICVNEV